MYDATIGRFLSQDPIGFEGGDANLYRYVKNGPTTKTDPSGRYEIDVHYYATLYLALAVGLGRNSTNLAASNGSFASEAHVVAWTCQHVDDYGPTGPYGGNAARRRFHFRDGETDFGVLQGGAESEIISNNGIVANNIFLFGLGLHPFEDSYSHAGFGPKSGHLSAGHEPDYPYNDVGKAMRMAERVYELLERWRDRQSQGSCVKSFFEIEDRLKYLFSLPGTAEERAIRWRYSILNDFGIDLPYDGKGGNHPWSPLLGSAASGVRE